MVYFTNYYKAKEYAKANHLVEADYGDWDEKVSYCMWNKTGDRNDTPVVEAYYIFDGRYPEKDESEWLDDWVKAEIGATVINH